MPGDFARTPTALTQPQGCLEGLHYYHFDDEHQASDAKPNKRIDCTYVDDGKSLRAA